MLSAVCSSSKTWGGMREKVLVQWALTLHVMDPTITLLQLALHYRPTPLQLLYLNLCVCLSNTACAMSGYPSCNGCQQYLLHADSWRHASVSAWHRWWWLNTVVKCQKRLSPGHDRVIDPWELLHSYAIYWFGLIRCKITTDTEKETNNNRDVAPIWWNKRRNIVKILNV